MIPTILNAVVLVIGIIMMAKFSKKGFATPPSLSGLAFILIGLSGLL